MNHAQPQHCGRLEQILSRRHLLQRAGGGFGGLALAELLASQGLLASENAESSTSDANKGNELNPLAPRASHFPPKAKSIIWLFMEGAPSSVDMFDPKPELTKRDGQKIAIDVFNGSLSDSFTRSGRLSNASFNFSDSHFF